MKKPTEKSTTPIVDTWGTVASFWRNTTHNACSYDSNSNLYEVHRAVNYFYNGLHDISAWYYNSGIRIISHSQTHSEFRGLFTYQQNAPAYITIYQNGTGANVIGTTLHELGHFVHYSERGGNYNNFYAVHNLLKESFASYVGWYLGERYYTALGYVKPYAWGNITYQARQTWTPTISGILNRYSPLFVDLVDDFEQQSRYGIAYNPDKIKDVPHSVMKRISKESSNWSSCRNILQEYAGRYYSNTELNTFLSPYDSWFTKN